MTVLNLIVTEAAGRLVTAIQLQLRKFKCFNTYYLGDLCFIPQEHEGSSECALYFSSKTNKQIIKSLKNI